MSRTSKWVILISIASEFGSIHWQTMEQIVCWFVGKLYFHHIIANVVAKDLAIHWWTTKQGLLTTCGRIVVIIVKLEVVRQWSMDQQQTKLSLAVCTWGVDGGLCVINFH